MLKGFMIFFTATACPVSWSLAELHHRQYLLVVPASRVLILPYEPKGSHAHRLQVRVSKLLSACALCSIASRPAAYLLVISKVVPKIWARTNSAILP